MKETPLDFGHVGTSADSIFVGNALLKIKVTGKGCLTNTVVVLNTDRKLSLGGRKIKDSEIELASRSEFWFGGNHSS